MPTSPSPTPQLLIARDIIDMARDYAGDYDVLEYLSNICFNLGQMHDGDDATCPVDWDGLFSILDEAYSRQDSSCVKKLDGMYRAVVRGLEAGRVTP